MGPSARRPSEDSPEGVSTARIRAGRGAVALFEKRLISSMPRAIRPVAGPRRPVPKRASTIASALATSGQADCQAASLSMRVISFPVSRQRWRFVLASPRNSSPAPNRSTRIRATLPSKRRAATKPSPPLFPLPQSTATRCGNRGENSRRTASATCFPAFSINCRLGMP